MLRGLNSFSGEHGRFSATTMELEQLIPSTIGPNPYRKDRSHLRHLIVFFPNASGAYSGSVGDEPGGLFYRVSSDCKEAWITVTQLDRPVGTRRSKLRQDPCHPERSFRPR